MFTIIFFKKKGRKEKKKKKVSPGLLLRSPIIPEHHKTQAMPGYTRFFCQARAISIAEPILAEGAAVLMPCRASKVRT